MPQRRCTLWPTTPYSQPYTCSTPYTQNRAPPPERGGGGQGGAVGGGMGGGEGGARGGGGEAKTQPQMEAEHEGLRDHVGVVCGLCWSSDDPGGDFLGDLGEVGGDRCCSVRRASVLLRDHVDNLA